MKKLLIRRVFLFFLGLNVFIGFSQNKKVFKVTGVPQSGFEQIGIRGDTPPLSWERTIFLNRDRVGFSTEIEFAPTNKKIEYKFVLDNGQEVQWEKIQNRRELLISNDTVFSSKWNLEKIIDPSTLSKLSVSQLMQDYEVIRTTILKIHPGLYRYNDSLSIDNNLKTLKESFQHPLTYGETFIAMSKFIATIQCDHTSVSSYNQEALINSQTK